MKVSLVKYPFSPLNSLWIPSRLVRDLRATSNAEEGYLIFSCEGSCKLLS